MKLNPNFFVYGTLQTDCSNHRVIPKKSIQSIVPATISGMDLFMFGRSSFPCMTYGTGTVIGEMITILPEYVEQVTAVMDRLEGFRETGDPDNFYDRITDHCTPLEGFETAVNVYLFNEFNGGLGEPLRDGNFKKHIQSIKKGVELV